MGFPHRPDSVNPQVIARSVQEWGCPWCRDLLVPIPAGFLQPSSGWCGYSDSQSQHLPKWGWAVRFACRHWYRPVLIEFSTFSTHLLKISKPSLVNPSGKKLCGVDILYFLISRLFSLSLLHFGIKVAARIRRLASASTAFWYFHCALKILSDQANMYPFQTLLSGRPSWTWASSRQCLQHRLHLVLMVSMDVLANFKIVRIDILRPLDVSILV